MTSSVLVLKKHTLRKEKTIFTYFYSNSIRCQTPFIAQFLLFLDISVIARPGETALAPSFFSRFKQAEYMRLNLQKNKQIFQSQVKRKKVD